MQNKNEINTKVTAENNHKLIRVIKKSYQVCCFPTKAFLRNLM